MQDEPLERVLSHNLQDLVDESVTLRLIFPSLVP
jgi:hypothetical protein